MAMPDDRIAQGPEPGGGTAVTRPHLPWLLAGPVLGALVLLAMVVPGVLLYGAEPGTSDALQRRADALRDLSRRDLCALPAPGPPGIYPGNAEPSGPDSLLPPDPAVLPAIPDVGGEGNPASTLQELILGATVRIVGGPVPMTGVVIDDRHVLTAAVAPEAGQGLGLQHPDLPTTIAVTVLPDTASWGLTILRADLPLTLHALPLVRVADKASHVFSASYIGPAEPVILPAWIVETGGGGTARHALTFRAAGALPGPGSPLFDACGRLVGIAAPASAPGTSNRPAVSAAALLEAGATAGPAPRVMDGECRLTPPQPDP